MYTERRLTQLLYFRFLKLLMFLAWLAKTIFIGNIPLCLVYNKMYTQRRLTQLL